MQTILFFSNNFDKFDQLIELSKKIEGKKIFLYIKEKKELLSFDDSFEEEFKREKEELKDKISKVYDLDTPFFAYEEDLVDHLEILSQRIEPNYSIGFADSKEYNKIAQKIFSNIVLLNNTKLKDAILVTKDYEFNLKTFLDISIKKVIFPFELDIEIETGVDPIFTSSSIEALYLQEMEEEHIKELFIKRAKELNIEAEFEVVTDTTSYLVENIDPLNIDTLIFDKYYFNIDYIELSKFNLVIFKEENNEN